MQEDLESSGAEKSEDEAARRLFVLRVIQPGLAGLMDGSVSTLAPVLAAAYATGHSRDAFLVGMAASIGAGISMGFAGSFRRRREGKSRIQRAFFRQQPTTWSSTRPTACMNA